VPIIQLPDISHILKTAHKNSVLRVLQTPLSEDRKAWREIKGEARFNMNDAQLLLLAPLSNNFSYLKINGLSW
jgi:hypothetical protein